MKLAQQCPTSFSLSWTSDKLKEALNKVRLKRFASLWEGSGRGAATAKRKANLCAAGFQPARIFGIDSVAASSPNPPQREGNLLNQSFLRFIGQAKRLQPRYELQPFASSHVKPAIYWS